MSSCWTDCLNWVIAHTRPPGLTLTQRLPPVPDSVEESEETWAEDTKAWFESQGARLLETECPRWPTTDWPCVVGGIRMVRGAPVPHCVVVQRVVVVFEPGGRRARLHGPWSCWQYIPPEWIAWEDEWIRRRIEVAQANKRSRKAEIRRDIRSAHRDIRKAAKAASAPLRPGDEVRIRAGTALARSLYTTRLNLFCDRRTLQSWGANPDAQPHTCHLVAPGQRDLWRVVQCECSGCARGRYVAVDELVHGSTRHLPVCSMERYLPDVGWRSMNTGETT